MKYYKKLIGKRLYLSPMSVEDAEKYTEWLNDFEITAFLKIINQVLTSEMEKDFINDISKSSQKIFSIVDTQSESLLGSCGLDSIDHINRVGMAGIFIGDKKYWNKGYGEEALNLLLDFGFNILNLHNIWLSVFSYNKRAIKCYEKIGFKQIGKRRESKYLNGKYYDEIYMDILEDDFKSPFITKKLEDIL